MRALILFLILALNMATEAQPPDTLWIRTFGGSARDMGHSVLQTEDEGFIIVGETQSYGAGGQDVWVIKTDSRGVLEWDQTYGAGNHEVGMCIQPTDDGGYIIVGAAVTWATMTDVLMIKIDADGYERWSNTFGGSDWDEGNYVQQTTDGGYVIAGRTRSYSEGYGNVWLIKTDRDGFEQWDHTYGGNQTDCGNCVEQTADGGYIITGYTDSFGAGQLDVWLVKTDSSGNEDWNRTFGGPNNDSGNAVRQTADGGYIIAGNANITYTGSDAWLIKTDSTGNVAWDRIFSRCCDDYASDVRLTNDGGYILAGASAPDSLYYDDLWLIKCDNDGDSLWSRSYGGVSAEWANCVQQTSDGGYVTVGYTQSYGAGEGDIWLVRVNSETSATPDFEVPSALEFALHPAHPNPFNNTTTFTYAIPHSGSVTFAIYDILGQRVATLFNGAQTAGIHSISWDAVSQSSGIYFCRLQSGAYSQCQKLVLIK